MSLSGPAHRAGPGLPARPMSTFPLGGRRVRRSGYGAMHLAGPWAVNPPADRASAIGVLRAAVAAGVDHIDTAQYYGPDVVNDLIREALSPYPPELAIVSKVGVFRDAGHDVQLASRYQGTQHHGSTASGPGTGKTAATLGLFSYDPVTEPV